MGNQQINLRMFLNEGFDISVEVKYVLSSIQYLAFKDAPGSRSERPLSNELRPSLSSLSCGDIPFITTFGFFMNGTMDKSCLKSSLMPPCNVTSTQFFRFGSLANLKARFSLQ